MKVVIVWDNVPCELRNALLQQAHDFKVAHPDCDYTVMVQSTPVVAVADIVREPAPTLAGGDMAPAALSPAEILDERRSLAPAAGPQLSPLTINARVSWAKSA